MNAVIKLENVSFGYGREKVLENVSLEIPKGIFLPFTGPNGAGKTTLLRGILGLLEPLSGKIKTPFAETPAGYVPQYKSIDPLFPVTVRGILKMGLYPKLGWWKNTDKEDRKKISAVVEELRLTKDLHKNYRDLSGGTKQKVLIGRALLSGAEIFILDEPTSELDEGTEHEVLQHLQRFVQKEGKTALVVYHGMHNPAVKMASQVCLVSHGKVRMLKTSELPESLT